MTQQIRNFHDEMVLAELSLVARQKGAMRRTKSLARRACRLETKAADLIPEQRTSEPTRSILYRSAASLAHQCGEIDTARCLAKKGLDGFPPPEIEQELQDLLTNQTPT
jgi:hypothetical protein